MPAGGWHTSGGEDSSGRFWIYSFRPVKLDPDVFRADPWRSALELKNAMEN